jgi:hypothetical protein
MDYSKLLLIYFKKHESIYFKKHESIYLKKHEKYLNDCVGFKCLRNISASLYIKSNNLYLSLSGLGVERQCWFIKKRVMLTLSINKTKLLFLYRPQPNNNNKYK